MKKSKNNVKQVTIQNKQSTINSCMKFLFRNNETHFEAFDFKKLPKVDIADLNKDNAYTRERLDTNNLPKDAKKEANIWTKKMYI